MHRLVAVLAVGVRLGLAAEAVRRARPGLGPAGARLVQRGGRAREVGAHRFGAVRREEAGGQLDPILQRLLLLYLDGEGVRAPLLVRATIRERCRAYARAEFQV